MNPTLSIDLLLQEAAIFSDAESRHDEPLLFGVTDGKAIGTYLEHKFVNYLLLKYSFSEGNSAFGIDLPALEVDIKVTSIRQPQSSCPFRSARQKVYGLGYHLLVFVYEKSDDPVTRSGRLAMRHTVFVNRTRTADFQMTTGIQQIVENDGNVDDLVAFFQDRNLPVDDVEAHNLAEEILKNPPLQGFLTISNALQWRLQYTRVIAHIRPRKTVASVRGCNGGSNTPESLRRQEKLAT